MSKRARIIGRRGRGPGRLGGVVGSASSGTAATRSRSRPRRSARRDLVSIVSASGEVKPKRYVNVGANVSGRIIELYVKEGDRVRRGQVLARIDAARFEAGERAVRGGGAGGAGRPRRARRPTSRSRASAFERTKQMHDEKLISDQDFDQADADFKMKRPPWTRSSAASAQQAADAGEHQRRPRARRPWSRPWTASSRASRRRRARS